LKTEKTAVIDGDFPNAAVPGKCRSDSDRGYHRAVYQTFVVQAFKIPSGSMKPTLQVGDHILVNKFIYGVKIPYLSSVVLPVKDPQRGTSWCSNFRWTPQGFH